LAKKWQDVEFVDYKERQRRRRLKRRQQATEDVTKEVTRQWNTTLISVFAVIFVLVVGGLSWFIMDSRAEEQLVQSRTYVTVLAVNGGLEQRLDATEEWQYLSAGEQIFAPRAFKTAPESRANLETFDHVKMSLLESSELVLDNIELFRDNQVTKSNVRLFGGDFIFDSRMSEGLLEIALDIFGDEPDARPKIYANPGQYKVQADMSAQEAWVKVSMGAARVEYQGRNIVVKPGDAVKIASTGVGVIERFNALQETW
jgi:hypothetical protein